MFPKHERGMKKALNSRLRSKVVVPEVGDPEVVGPDVYQGFTTDEVETSLRNINPIKAAVPDRIHQRFQRHLGPVSISLLTNIINKSWAETKVPQEWSKPTSYQYQK